MSASSEILQSDNWEQFQRALGRQTWRVDGVLAIGIPLPLGGMYLSSPRGPFSPSLPRPSGSSNTQEIARETGAVFWRGEFREGEEGEHTLAHPRILRRLVEPQYTWRTSLIPSLEEILSTMHQKHRYNIRLALKRGVTVSAASETGIFWTLLQETAARQGIRTHDRSYYDTMLTSLKGVALLIAEHEGEPLAAAVVVHSGDTATYLHGGSSYEHRSSMAPLVLHWYAMQRAKDAGMRWYDFGGVMPPRRVATSHKPQVMSWEGMTRFKMGFGGELVEHPPTRDLVFRHGRYTLLSVLARLRP